MSIVNWKLFKPKDEFKDALHELEAIPSSYSTERGVTYRVIDVVTKDDSHMSEEQLLKFWEVDDAKDSQ